MEWCKKTSNQHVILSQRPRIVAETTNWGVGEETVWAQTWPPIVAPSHAGRCESVPMGKLLWGLHMLGHIFCPWKCSHQRFSDLTNLKAQRAADKLTAIIEMWDGWSGGHSRWQTPPMSDKLHFYLCYVQYLYIKSGNFESDCLFHYSLEVSSEMQLDRELTEELGRRCGT